MPMLQLDHITLAASSLAEGVAYAERALGVSIPAGGTHPSMGTHNHLLRLGDGLFLEVIAVDPGAGPLSRPRWFGLDDPALRAELALSPRLATWVVNTIDIATALASVPHAARPAVRVSRGALEWLISVPPDGSMPFNGAFPTIIEWPTGPHPSSRMPDLGCSLIALDIGHPDHKLISASLAPFLHDRRVRFADAAVPSLRVTIKTPDGERELF
jgi:hypothetical protein